MKLYQHPISGHCHRVALYLSLTDTPYEPVLVDVAAGEQKSAAFLAKNAFGQVPVLEDDGVILADSCATVPSIRASISWANLFGISPSLIVFNAFAHSCRR